MDHQQIVNGLTKELKPLLDNSKQAMYLYLDDHHKSCNAKFANLLGYSGAAQWAKEKGPFLDKWVDKGSRKKLVQSYMNAMDYGVASKFAVTLKNKKGKKIKTSVILAPLCYKGHAFAIHFISK